MNYKIYTSIPEQSLHAFQLLSVAAQYYFKVTIF